MSTGITIDVKDEKAEISGYYQNFAEEFDDLASFLKDDGCDLIPYLFCPESYQSEEEIREWFEYDDDATEESINAAIAYNKLITTETYSSIQEVYAAMTKARNIASGYGEERFHHGKEALLLDLDELIAELEKKKDDEFEVQFVRA
ncbi:hypothetical protein NT6N_23480 [Oceaniferula spumae]|uniref:Uncharacterized protein n=1 Tax=Oceaniferula spumae TaxID=2979115 RepID=A0AAT9FMX7_9BACT